MENLGVGEGDEFDTPLAPVSTPKVVGGYFDGSWRQLVVDWRQCVVRAIVHCIADHVRREEVRSERGSSCKRGVLRHGPALGS